MTLVALVALVAGTAAWAASRPPDCLALGPTTKDVVAKIDPARGCVVATYPVGRGPSLIVAAHDELWVANADDRTITALSAAGRPVATVGLGATSMAAITAMAADANALYVLDGHDGILTSVVLETATVDGWADGLPGRGEGGLVSADAYAKIKSLLPDWAFIVWVTSPQREYGGLAVEPGHVWVSNWNTGQLVRDPSARVFFNPVRGSILQVDPAVDPLAVACITAAEDLDPRMPGPVACVGQPSWASSGGDPRPFTGQIAIVGSTIWAGHRSPALSGFDRDSGLVRHVTPYGASGGATGMTTLGKDLWVAYSGGQVARLAAGATAAQVATVAPQLSAITADASGVYAASGNGHELLRLDPATLAVTGRVDVGGRAAGVAVAPDGSVWVTISALNG